jgi:integrase
LALGLGRLGPDDLVFTLADGSPYPPDKLSRDWGLAVKSLGLPSVTFHALRHSHASALIAAGVDIVTVSRRLGHGSPAITLSIYAHAFGAHKDAAAALAIEAAMGARK